MKKYLLILVAGIFGILTANAWSVSFSTNDEGKSVATITGSGSDSQNWSDDSFTASERTGIVNADILVFKGTINTLKPFDGAGCKATTVDFSNAYFPETSPGAGPFTFYEYNPSSTVSPKYNMVKTTNPQTQATTIDYVEAEGGKYVKHENVYYKTNEMRFDYFKSCTNPILSKHVESICQNCINNMSQLTTTFTIPDNIKFIAAGAVDNTPITSITIPSSVEYIQTGAIRNASTNALIDVTVESASTVCANGGFLKDISVGQTNAGYMNYAVLHFPEGADEYFVNQTHELSVEVSLNKGWFQQWLDQHYSGAGNGWQEFINSAPGTPIQTDKPVVLRTFSDKVAHYVPLCYRAYIVNGVKKNRETGSYELILQETYAIPANTGVIIYGEAATGEFALPILSGSTWNNNPYDRTERKVTVDNKEINLQNYLVANCTLSKDAKIGPYELGADGKVAERNFVMGRYEKTDLYADHPAEDYMAFFRAKTMKPGMNKAHLKVPSSMYQEPKGYEFIAVNPSDFRKTQWPRSFTEYGDWGTRDSSLPPFLSKSFGEPFEDEATAISNVTTENAEDAAIYTLQGVKVENPSKGIYIQNGKKFIVK